MDISFAGVDGYIENRENGALIVATNNTERMRLTNDGYLRFASSAGGIQFKGVTDADDALDDYEQGVWSSTVSGITASTNSVTGIYTKVGNAVFIHGHVLIAGKTAGSGNVSFTLPFQPKQATTSQYGMQITRNNINTSYYYVAPYSGIATCFFYASNQQAMTGTIMGNGEIAFNGAYITNT